MPSVDQKESLIYMCYSFSEILELIRSQGFNISSTSLLFPFGISSMLLNSMVS